MKDHIGRLHTHYQMLGSADAAGAAVTRLKRLAQTEMAPAMAEALDHALGSDPTVYVLRKSHARLVLNVSDEATDKQLAQQWANYLIGAVVRHIAHDAGNGRNLIQFASRADYVAHFISALLRGQAWQQWFYQAFTPFRTDSPRETIRRLLLDDADQVPAILGALQRCNALESMLAALDDADIIAIWRDGLGGQAGSVADPITLQPLFHQALQLVHLLDLWRQPPIPSSLWQQYLAAGPSPTDWRDQRGLAAAILSVISFLARHRQLKAIAADTLRAQLAPALSNFDWLDVEWLGPALLDLLGSEGAPVDLPGRPADRSPTPRQQALLADLVVLLAAGQAALDLQHPDSAANALRLYARLVDRAPRWAGDPLATAMIQRVLAAWTWLSRSHSPEFALQCLRQGHVAGALEQLPAFSRERAVPAFQFLVGLGQPGLDLMTHLAGSPVASGALRHQPDGPSAAGPSKPASSANEFVESNCAGLFLLLRAVLDARLPALSAQASYPSAGQLPALSALLLALGLRWAGAFGLRAGVIDPGLALFAGQEEPVTLGALRQTWQMTTAADQARFQAALLHVLAGHRLLPGTEFRLHLLTLAGDRRALVAGDAAAGLWPLGWIITDVAAVPDVVTNWLDHWQTATGWRPTLAVGPGLAATLPTLAEVAVSSASPSSDENGQTALLAALLDLAAGQLGLPEADLTVSLTAIALLRLWARWLRQFAASSTSYVLHQFIRRPGRIASGSNTIRVEMEPRPLDMVLDMAGYAARLERVPWLDQRDVIFDTCAL